MRIAARGGAEQVVYRCHLSHLSKYSQGACWRVLSPSFSVQVPLLTHLGCLALCLSGESEVGPASTSAQWGQSIHVTTWAPGQSKVLLPLGLMGKGTGAAQGQD